MGKKNATVLRILLAIVLFSWPLMATETLRLLPIGLAMFIWGASAVGAVVLLSVSLTKSLRDQGRAWTADRPALGLAGKPWGVLAPNAILPAALIFGFGLLGYGYFQNQRPLLILVSLAILTRFAYVYAASVRGSSLQRRSIALRDDDEEYSRLASRAVHDTAARASFDALESIADAFKVPATKLRPTDRFGHEVGSFLSLDETVDRIGGQLLTRQRATRKPLAIDHVKTVGDYLREWSR